MKGENNYKPKVGEQVLISPPNSDDSNGYVYQEYEVFWMDDIFILYGNAGYYPNLEKQKHVAIKQKN